MVPGLYAPRPGTPESTSPPKLPMAHDVRTDTMRSTLKKDWYFQVCQDEVCKDQVPDLPYLNATTWASHEFLHNPTVTAHDPPSTMTCPAE